MRILFLSALYPPVTRGGAEISTHLLARGLLARGHEVSVLTEGDSSRSGDREESVFEGVRVVRLRAPFSRKVLFEGWQSKHLARILTREIADPRVYDVIHAHDFRMAMALSETGWTNTAVTARDYAQISGCTNDMQQNGVVEPGCSDLAHMWQCHRIQEASGLRRYARYAQYRINYGYRRRAFLALPRQVFISQAQQARILLHQDLRGRQTAVIHNPVAPEWLRQRVVQGGAAHLLYVGTVEEYKGVGLLLSVWPDIAKEYPQAHLTIVGDGADRRRYEALVSRLGMQYRVTFAGRVPYERLRQVYDRADAVVAPHLWIEPFGRTVAEAMARGKIVIAANVGGPQELLGNGERGILFERGSRQSLTEALRRFFAIGRYDRRALGEAGRRWVEEHLSIENIARQYEQFYGGDGE